MTNAPKNAISPAKGLSDAANLAPAAARKDFSTCDADLHIVLSNVKANQDTLQVHGVQHLRVALYCDRENSQV